APEAAPTPTPLPAAAAAREKPAVRPSPPAASKPHPHPAVVQHKRPKAAAGHPQGHRERDAAAKARPAGGSAEQPFCAPGFTKIRDPKNPFGFDAFICAPN
ncbi:MAG: hypothetical protein KGM15_10485, partial [Pseudomonadota bacterium]|nr:hypothetical protein [Pseudomonadota bacterium]